MRKAIIAVLIILIALVGIAILVLLPYWSDQIMSKDNSDSLSLKMTSSVQQNPVVNVEYQNIIIYQNVPEVHSVCKSCHDDGCLRETQRTIF